MKINKDSSWVHLYEYLGETLHPYTDLCNLVRGCLVNVLALSVFCTLVGAYLGDMLATVLTVVGYGQVPSSVSLFITAVVIGALALVHGALPLEGSIRGQMKHVKRSVLVQYAKGKMNKFCPTVEIVESKDGN